MQVAKELRSRAGMRRRELDWWVGSRAFRRRYGFDRPPAWSDLTGYEPMLDVILDRGLLDLDGDLLEIGVFLGGGTRKLAELAARRAPAKRVLAVDVFDVDFDATASLEGLEMREYYQRFMERAGATDQRSTFDAITRGCANVDVIVGDSVEVAIPTDALCFSFIDGHHAADYVRADFETAWGRTVPGGVVALHDYGGDLPPVTHTVHELIGRHATGIARVWTENIIVFVERA